MRSEYRLSVLKKIEEYERKGLWDADVEADSQAEVVLPADVDYLNEKLSSKIKTAVMNRVAQLYYELKIIKKQFVIKQINGLENVRNISGGAIITCNHFHPNDNYAIYRALRKEFRIGQRLYKVIKEGNYQAKGFFGTVFRNCNTLPLSSNTETMKNMLKAVSVLLKRGEKILVYPEQAMWWNYKKPRPLKSGAYRFAVKNDVPIIPAFITMEDTDKLDSEGFNVQAYTIWFLPPIYKSMELNDKENERYMMEENFKRWQEIYETVYKIPLQYEVDCDSVRQ